MRIAVIVTLSQRLEGTMPTAATLGKTTAHRYDPIGPLADAIGARMLRYIISSKLPISDKV
jgi:hypothetical protein